ncbi:hypothetical protein BKA65DRAFT_474000 [Rhexocercosporidium sp. MPI-PUGE-AT-0058]|nr:hypothetical protein BKA65DRAFT_474000 [Rhexocercosporidium sp. MPI-PUGE-AT-0058]
MSYVTPPDITRIPGFITFVGATGPKLPNTSVWVWFCCSCSQANQRPRETETYSLCRACQHERCRDCSIRWSGRTISQEYLKRATDRTIALADGIYTPKTYFKLKQEDEDEAAKHGLETTWGRIARQKREEAEMYALAERLVEEEEAVERAKRGVIASGVGIGGIVGFRGGGTESSESGSSGESAKGELGDVGRMVEKLVI